MKRRFVVEMTWNEPGEYVFNSLIGIIADDVLTGVLGLIFYGPYDKAIHSRQAIAAFAPASWRFYRELYEDEMFPENIPILGREGREQVTNADAETKSNELPT